MHVLGLIGFPVGWLKGGHPERFGAAVLLLNYLVSSQVHLWRIGNFYFGSAAGDFVLLLIFGWMALKTDRWWPFVVTAALALAMTIHLLTLTMPDLSRYAATSAQIGLWILINLTVLAGVFERWLAGEPAVSGRIRWRRAPYTP